VPAAKPARNADGGLAVVLEADALGAQFLQGLHQRGDRAALDLLVAGEVRGSARLGQGCRAHGHAERRAGVEHIDGLAGRRDLAAEAGYFPCLVVGRVDPGSEGPVTQNRGLGIAGPQRVADDALAAGQRGDGDGADGVRLRRGDRNGAFEPGFPGYQLHSDLSRKELMETLR